MKQPLLFLLLLALSGLFAVPANSQTDTTPAKTSGEAGKLSSKDNLWCDLAREPKQTSTGAVFPNVANGEWLTWDEMQAKITYWRQTYPNLVHESSLGKSLEGRNIPLLRLADEAEPNANEPEVLLMAGIHPREQAPQVCLARLVDELLAGYSKDKRLTELLKTRQIWVIPVLNVDGKVHDFTDSKVKPADWRKNRRKNDDGTFGVDLNRNFAVRWGGSRQVDPTWRTTTTNTAGNIYEGSGPLSEPESRLLAEFIGSRKNLRAFMDIHSPLRVILFPAYTVKAEHERFQKIARGMQARQKQPYPISKDARADTEPKAEERGGNSGLTYTWAYYTQGVYGFNFEFGTPDRTTGVKGRYPTPQDIATEYQANFREPMLFFLESIGELKPASAGNLTLSGLVQGRTIAPRLSGKPTPGAILTLTPPPVAEKIEWAVLVSETAGAVVQSEYRRYPLTSGFTIKIEATTRPGTELPFTLYLWEPGRKVSRLPLSLKVEEPAN